MVLCLWLISSTGPSPRRLQMVNAETGKQEFYLCRSPHGWKGLHHSWAPSVSFSRPLAWNWNGKQSSQDPPNSDMERSCHKKQLCPLDQHVRPWCRNFKTYMLSSKFHFLFPGFLLIEVYDSNYLVVLNKPLCVDNCSVQKWCISFQVVCKAPLHTQKFNERTLELPLLSKGDSSFIFWYFLLMWLLLEIVLEVEKASLWNHRLTE